MINRRSITFQLVGWYATTLTVLALVFGTAAFAMVRKYLMNSLKDRQVMRARFLSESVQRWTQEGKEIDWEGRIESALAPRANNRVVRLSRGDTVLYDSGPHVAREMARENFWKGSTPFPPSSLAGIRMVTFTRTVNA